MKRIWTVLFVVVMASCSRPAETPPETAAKVAETPATAAPAPAETAAPQAEPAATPAPVPATEPAPADAPAAKAESTPAAPAPAADPSASWIRFQGPDAYNVSADKGLLKSWPEAGPRLIWTAKGIGNGYSSVTLADGQIYTSGNIEREGNQTVVTALDMDGKILWQTAVGPAWTADYPGTRSTPTIDGERIYYESPVGDLACLEAKSGRKLWSVNILQEFDAENLKWALSESVLIDGPRVICCPGGKKASVAALDKMTGKTVWAAKSSGDLAGYGSPSLIQHQGMRLIVTMTSKAIIGVNADTGDFLWRYPHETAYDVNACTPIFRDGWIFFSTGYRAGSVMLKLAVDGAKASVEKVWESKDLDNQHGGLSLLGDTLYGSSHNIKGGKWMALDWKTGKTLYVERGVGRGSLVAADGMLFLLSEKRNVGLAPATPEGLNLAGKFDMPSGGEGPSWAHPVVCGGRLYLRHDDALCAYDVRAGK